MTKQWMYFDTSAFLKLTIEENGSETARKKARTSHVLSSGILPVECFTAVSRRKREGSIREVDFQQIIKAIRESLLSPEIIGISDDVLKKAEDVALLSTARAIDAIHIASALMFQERTGVETSFVTSDKKQSYAAAQVGLNVIFID